MIGDVLAGSTWPSREALVAAARYLALARQAANFAHESIYVAGAPHERRLALEIEVVSARMLDALEQYEPGVIEVAED